MRCALLRAQHHETAVDRRPESRLRKLPPGIYEEVITSGTDQALASLPREVQERVALDPAEAHVVLARHVERVLRDVLLGMGADERERLQKQVELVNSLVASLDIALGSESSSVVAESPEMLHAIASTPSLPGLVQFPRRPETPLSVSALLVNGRNQPRIGHEVKRELGSSDRVDLLCAFVKWTGLRVLEPDLEEFIERGGSLRVLTTTYMGATEADALDRLVEMGAEVKVSYDTRSTRLHAKAWLFHRFTGPSTAYVGSSNLSRAALLDGLEWNVRLSSVEQEHVLNVIRATFEQYWSDSAFESYDPADPLQQQRLRDALRAAAVNEADFPLSIAPLNIQPWPFQQEVLDNLEAEREIHQRWRNLVVMATGTGKTVVAGLDYRRLRESGQVETLLFVAHREEILSQSLATFRHILRDGSFGERYVGGAKPTEWRHVFASIQSLSQLELDRLEPDRFDMVIVDEFHHAGAETYSRLLAHLRPRVLVGLTATPERADGVDIRAWFDGGLATELRLWEALDRELLSPFQYFGISDGTDLSSLRWKRGVGYDEAELSNLYTGHDARVAIILERIRAKLSSPGRMRALGFCVSVEHAEFMARRFTEQGIPSRAVTSRTAPEDRRESLIALRNREVNVLFTVDLFNEGVDIPEIDTVLMLRPTQSATVFLQQLGRGLRRADGKSCLTVLDFIGGQHAEFRFDLRYRALYGNTRRQIESEIERGFPSLPAGCHMELDRVARDVVLDNIRRALRLNRRTLQAELRAIGECSIPQFLEALSLELEDLYRFAPGGWASLRREAGLDTSVSDDDDVRLGRALPRYLHPDDPERLDFLARILAEDRPPSRVDLPIREQRLLQMFHFSMWGANQPIETLEVKLADLWRNHARMRELSDLIEVLRSRIRRVPRPLDLARVPLNVHATYSRDEALAAFGIDKPGTVREGVRWIEAEASDVFLVTLQKTEKQYSPTTMYQDRAISPSIFQWESQSKTSERSATGERYMNHIAGGSSVHFFIRDSKETDGALGTRPYFYAGRASYVGHVNDRPMRITWRLESDLPADVFHAARVAAG